VPSSSSSPFAARVTTIDARRSPPARTDAAVTDAPAHRPLADAAHTRRVVTDIILPRLLSTTFVATAADAAVVVIPHARADMSRRTNVNLSTASNGACEPRGARRTVSHGDADDLSMGVHFLPRDDVIWWSSRAVSVGLRISRVR
jgi:hypothetical protein